MNEKEAAIIDFLEKHGDDFIYWRDGTIMIESYFEKLFVALGGNIDRIVALFEDYGAMHEAAAHYFFSLRNNRRERTWMNN
jgi:hypothetical protein